MTSRASMWDGTGWVSMTGGIESSDGGGEPDDNYLRLDGANNPIAPSNFLRQSDGDARYLGLTANAVSASVWATGRSLTLTGDVSGVVWWDGGANVSMATTVANDSHTHGAQYYTKAESDGQYLRLTGGTVTGQLIMQGGGQVTGAGGPGWGGAIVRNIIRSNVLPTAGEGAHGDMYVQYQ